MGLLVLERRFRFLKKVSRVLIADCTGDPCDWNGAAGRGFLSSWTRSVRIEVTLSVEDVAGMGNLDGRKTTVSHVRVPLVLIINTV